MTQPEGGKQLDTRPSWLKGAQAEEGRPGTITVDGVSYQYTLVRRGLSLDLPYVVGFKLADGSENLFISEDVPEQYRPFIISHEIREERKFFNLPEEERCRVALEDELSSVKNSMPERYQEYLAQRMAFFDSLAALYEQPRQAKEKSPQFIQGIRASRDVLHSIHS